MSLFVDTHKMHSRLVAAGFEKTKADAIVSVFGDANDQVATKKDLEILENRLTIKIWTVGATIVGVIAAFNFIG